MVESIEIHHTSNASLALNKGDKQSTIGLMIDSVDNPQQISDLNFSWKNTIAMLNIFSFQTVSSKLTQNKIGTIQFKYPYFTSWLPGIINNMIQRDII